MGRLRSLHRARSRALALAALVAVLPGLAGCSAGGDDDDAGPTTTSGAVTSTGTPTTAVPTPTTDPGPRPGGTLRVGVPALASLDPALADTVAELWAADLVYDGLTAVDPVTGDLVPAVAASWDASDDLRTWTFLLDGTRTFHDGTPVDSAAVVRTLERMAAPGVVAPQVVTLEALEGYRSFHGGDLPTLTGVRGLDPLTVTITTTEPWAQLPWALSHPAFGLVPPTAPAAAPEAVVPGAGPFRVGPGDATRLSLLRFDGAVPVPLLDGVDLVVVPVADQLAALDAGGLDVATVTPGQLPDATVRYGPAGVRPLSSAVWFGLRVDAGALADQRFRAGVVAAVDRATVVGLALGPTAVVAGGVLPGAIGAAPCGPACAFDRVLAEALVAQVFPDGDTPELDVDHGPDPLDATLAEAVAADLGAALVPAVTDVHEDYPAFLAEGGQEVFRWGAAAGYPLPDAVLWPAFSSGRPDNLTGFSDPEVDRLLREARTSLDPAAQTAAWQAAQDRIHAAAVVLPLVDGSSRLVWSGRLRDLAVGPTGLLAAERAWFADG